MALLAAGCASLSPEPAAAQGTSATERPVGMHANVRLLAAAPDAAPGTTVYLGVSFTIEPGWHLYWKGRNDTGEAPKVKLELPAGITAGEVRWPAPVRHVMGGDILDHVYERAVTLIVPLKIAPDAAPGTVANISASCSWLVCRNVCVFESGVAQTTVRVRSKDERGGTESEEIAAAVRRLPRILEPGSTEVVAVQKIIEKAGHDEGVVDISVQGASILEFYPDDECVEIADPIADCRTESEQLHIRLKASQVDSQKALSGVLGVWKPSSTVPAYYLLKVGRAR